MLKTENIKTIVVDLNRTLLHTDKTLFAYTIKVLNECKKCLQCGAVCYIITSDDSSFYFVS